MSTCALILAAGKGTRLHSVSPKVLKELLGEPMLFYVYEALSGLLDVPAYTVVGFGHEEVRAAFPEAGERFILQEEQLGTGHALMVSIDRLAQDGMQRVLVLNGDTPLIRPRSLDQLMEHADRTKADICFSTIVPDDPAAFGRVVRDSSGAVAAIVEAKDFDESIHGPSTGEVNAGVYVLNLETVEPLLDNLSRANKSGEYYVTDLVALGLKHGLKVEALSCGNDTDLLGINTATELVAAESRLRERIVAGHLEAGVVVRNPEAVRIGPMIDIEPGTEITGPCEIMGRTTIRGRCSISASCMIMDADLTGCEIKHFCHVEGAVVEQGCAVGPYARLRPGAVLRQGAKVGNFVEVKKAELGRGAKASHLTYLGDARVGAGANIGAGTITCNYDGVNKHVTDIGANAFIGSNTALVAPVTVGDNALVAAGSTVTEDVPEHGLALARARQVNKKRK